MREAGQELWCDPQRQEGRQGVGLLWLCDVRCFSSCTVTVAGLERETLLLGLPP